MLLYYFQVISYKQNAYHQMEEVFCESFSVTRWSLKGAVALPGHVSPASRSGRYPHHQSCFIDEDIRHKENSPPQHYKSLSGVC